ncbi:hypothetical protein LPW11_07310 [Geomonas sp. RF6]|uniref:hypothetical protein n=1 Tax=Geomonas sp. RF6 TaxID=2897342 RepID=UPI001E2F7BCA|nr:hypothetical protein [Geomonas sp. RF6]UFS71992.1 hypothetical protein LPW11_07310 [Geomonas sp. RF6]
MGTSAILFTIAAFGGVAMLAMRRGGRPIPPLALAVPHGLVVVAGAVALADALKGRTIPTITLVALIGFVIAAIAGTILFLFFHLRQKSLPLPLTYVHGAVAAISFIMFLVSVFGP